MQVDPVLIIVVIGSVGGLLIERFFYYRSKYKEKKCKPENPSHGERLAALEKGQKNIEERLDKIEARLP